MASSLNKILFYSPPDIIATTVLQEAAPFYEFDLSSSQEDLTIKLCSNKDERPFCIYLKQSQKKLHPDSINQAVLCLTQPNYFKEDSLPILLLANNDVLTNEAKEYLNTQGLNIRLMTTEENDSENLWLIKQGANLTQLQVDYEKRITSQQFINKWIIIEDVLSQKELLLLIDGLTHTEDHLKRKFPVLEILATTNKTLKLQNSILEEENEYLKRELGHYKIFNKQLKEQDESERILRFYHKEYEQLPLWYKRLGHVIKVILGKRKLSSLYKKNNL
jgi:regulator of replication initiation timing